MKAKKSIILIHDYKSKRFPGVKKAVKEFYGSLNIIDEIIVSTAIIK
jgi:hypothetical protein